MPVEQITFNIGAIILIGGFVISGVIWAIRLDGKVKLYHKLSDEKIKKQEESLDKIETQFRSIAGDIIKDNNEKIKDVGTKLEGIEKEVKIIALALSELNGYLSATENKNQKKKNRN
jgi:archaellum component FlaC